MNNKWYNRSYFIIGFMVFTITTVLVLESLLQDVHNVKQFKKWFYPYQANFMLGKAPIIEPYKCTQSPFLIIQAPVLEEDNPAFFNTIDQTFNQLNLNPSSLTSFWNINLTEFQVKDFSLAAPLQVDFTMLLTVYGFYHTTNTLPEYNQDRFLSSWEIMKQSAIDYSDEINISQIPQFNHLLLPSLEWMQLAEGAGVDMWNYLPLTEKDNPHRIPMVCRFFNPEISEKTYILPTSTLCFIQNALNAQSVELLKDEIQIKTTDQKVISLPIDPFGRILIDYSNIPHNPVLVSAEKSEENAGFIQDCSMESTFIFLEENIGNTVSMDNPVSPLSLSSVALYHSIRNNHIMHRLPYYIYQLLGLILVGSIVVIYFGWKRGWRLYGFIGFLAFIMVLLLLWLGFHYFIDLYSLLVMGTLSTIILLIHKSIRELLR